MAVKASGYEFVSIIEIDNKTKRLIEDYDPKALSWLNKRGVTDRCDVAWDEKGKTAIGKILVAGEDPINEPVIWVEKKSKHLIPLSEVSAIVLLKEIDRKGEAVSKK